MIRADGMYFVKAGHFEVRDIVSVFRTIIQVMLFFATLCQQERRAVACMFGGPRSVLFFTSHGDGLEERAAYADRAIAKAGRVYIKGVTYGAAAPLVAAWGLSRINEWTGPERQRLLHAPVYYAD